MLLLLSTALAGDGLQARLYPDGIDTLTEAFEDTDYRVDKREVGAEYDCWDYIGVRDLNLDVPLRTLDVTTDADGVTVELAFDEIRGEDMEVYALDSEYTDLCVEFDAWVYYVSLTDARLTATIRPEVRDGALTFAVVGTPVVTGDLDTDVDNFPDDLVLYFFEETLLETLGESIGELVPEMLDEALAGPLLEGELEAFTYAATVRDVDVSRDGLFAGAALEVGWTGDDGCPGGRADPQGRDADLVFGDGDGASLGIGVTEAQTADIVRALWEDGWFCFTRENVEEFLGNITSLFDPSVGGIAATASLSAPPEVKIDPDGIALTLPGFAIEVTGEIDGQTTQVLRAAGSVSAVAELALDQELSAFVLSLHDLRLDLTAFEAAHLVSDREGAEDDLRDFLTGWVAEWAERSAQDIPLYAGLFQAYGWYLKVDRLDLQEGGVVLFVSVYAEGDPAIDDTPPDTEAEAERIGEDGVRLTLWGTDDGDEPLAFAVELDGGGWSGWQTESTWEESGLGPGEHVARVKSRDAWWNEDPSPVELRFDVEALPEAKDPEEGGCGCGTGGAPGGVAALLAALLLARRRR